MIIKKKVRGRLWDFIGAVYKDSRDTTEFISEDLTGLYLVGNDFLDVFKAHPYEVTDYIYKRPRLLYDLEEMNGEALSILELYRLKIQKIRGREQCGFY